MGSAPSRGSASSANICERERGAWAEMRSRRAVLHVCWWDNWLGRWTVRENARGVGYQLLGKNRRAGKLFRFQSLQIRGRRVRGLRTIWPAKFPRICRSKLHSPRIGRIPGPVTSVRMWRAKQTRQGSGRTPPTLYLRSQVESQALSWSYTKSFLRLENHLREIDQNIIQPTCRYNKFPRAGRQIAGV